MDCCLILTEPCCASICASICVNFCLIAKSFWLDPSSYWSMFQMAMGLGAVIFVHELGHFLVAKACGVKCEKFYVGFDAFDIKIGDRVIVPRSLVKTQWGETEYGIGILPLGGYVKMLGQDDNPANMEAEIQRSMADGEDPGEAVAAGLVDREKMDPRSYLAKSVIQRMAIISAGVVFNLLFAVLFAAIAFKSGVNYEPPSIGNVIGGGPAWENNLVGAEIEKIAGQQVTGTYFTNSDMIHEIIFNEAGTPLEFEVTRYGESQPETVALIPRKGLRRAARDIPFVGVSGRVKPVVGNPGAIEGTAAFEAEPKLKPGDKIVELAGRKIETDIDLRHALTEFSADEVEFVVERTDKDDNVETIRTMVGTNPIRHFGFSLKWKSITAIQQNSPAERAGLKVGDEIIGVNGQPRGDLLLFDRAMIAAARDNQTVELTVLRDGNEETISIEPVVPYVISDLGDDQPLAIDALGVAIDWSHEVESIDAGGPAAAAGLQKGDVIESLEFRLTEAQKKDPLNANMIGRTFDIKNKKVSFPELASGAAQQLAPGSKFELTVNREGKAEKVELESIASDKYFSEKRGIALTKFQKHYQSPTWSQAFSLGARQVVNDGTRVLKFLGKLVTGGVSPKNLGGPASIAYVATSEAGQGTSRLLLFLTLLSANLAVVNFLPIPVLDGGHMMFLAYEGLFRRPVTPAVQNILMLVGFVLIIGLMLFVLSLDFFRFMPQ